MEGLKKLVYLEVENAAHLSRQATAALCKGMESCNRVSRNKGIDILRVCSCGADSESLERQVEVLLTKLDVRAWAVLEAVKNGRVTLVIFAESMRYNQELYLEVNQLNIIAKLGVEVAIDFRSLSDADDG